MSAYREIAAIALLFTTAGCDGANSETGTTATTSVAVTLRYTSATPAGTLDPTFGTGGKVTTNVGPVAQANVAIQPDGRIVVIAPVADGIAAAQVFAVIRYLPSGALDTTFGTGGIARTAFTNGFNVPNVVAIQRDGRIVVAGSASDSTNSTQKVAIARYNSNGALDASFGHGGEVTTVWLGNDDVANVALLQPDGKLLVGGLAMTCFGRNCAQDTALARYNTDGTLDTSFGSGGSVIVNAIGPVEALALEADGSVVAANGTSNAVAVARFSATGASEPVSLLGSLSPIAATGTAIFQADGRIVLGGVGRGLTRHDDDLHMFRFGLDGTPDPSFHSPVFAFGGATARGENVAQSVLVLPNGKILAGGIATLPSFDNAFGLARFGADGALDTSFGKGGVTTTRFSGSADQIKALAQQPDGKIVAVGLTLIDSNGNTAIALARYTDF